jgi:hypothetical protein
MCRWLASIAAAPLCCKGKNCNLWTRQQTGNAELDADRRLVIYFTRLRLPIIPLSVAGRPADKRHAARKARFAEFARAAEYDRSRSYGRRFDCA